MSAFETCTRRNQWTDEEITLLRYKFATGKRIKIIADEIGRSETAVNKFLSRAGIRRKGTRSRFVGLTRRNKPRNHHILSMDSRITGRMYPDEVPIDIDGVVHYLRSKGHKISKFSNRDYQYYGGENEGYICDGHPISETKLLLLANRLRTEERQPIFTVNSLVWW
ncbi:MAG: hypothetical protein LBD43_02790 [Holosporales bacterium]|jgi:hypothetical protein|nr:hypothetical protein [Holosporales bacterium]